jgi:hypothetical protein
MDLKVLVDDPGFQFRLCKFNVVVETSVAALFEGVDAFKDDVVVANLASML